MFCALSLLLPRPALGRVKNTIDVLFDNAVLLHLLFRLAVILIQFCLLYTSIAAALLKDGKVKIKGMYSTKTGKTFDGVVLLADTSGKYVNFRVEQNRK